MPIVSSLSAREVGAIPISIGTSLAIESVLGILPEHETDTPAINGADELWINVRTLYRNILGAVDKDARGGLTPEEITDTLLNEMQTIESALMHQTTGRVQSIFYFCTYHSVTRKFPHAIHKQANTPLQKQASLLEQLTMKALLEARPPNDFRKFDLDFHDVQKRALIITHYPIDLLNRYKFTTLTLLESHTGALKPPSRWYTKLQNGKDLYNIPFDRMTLQLFGDGVMFLPVNIKVRRAVVDLAGKWKWSSVTTKDYILKSVKEEHEPILEAFIMKLY